MLAAFWSVKGGVGTTVVAATSALSWSNPREVLIVDLGGDLAACFGRPEPEEGLAEWARVGTEAPADALHRLTVPVAPQLSLLGRGSGTIDESAVSVIGAWLRAEPRVVVLDAGVITDRHSPAARLALLADESFLVLRPCYLALRRSQQLPIAPSGIVVVDENYRSFDPADIESIVGVPVVATIPASPVLARAVDAGLLGSRLPRTITRPLEGLAA